MDITEEFSERISRDKLLKKAESRIRTELPAFTLLESLDSGLEPKEIAKELTRIKARIKKIEACLRLQQGVNFAEILLIFRKKVERAESLRASVRHSRIFELLYSKLLLDIRQLKKDIERTCAEADVDSSPYTKCYSVLEENDNESFESQTKEIGHSRMPFRGSSNTH